MNQILGAASSALAPMLGRSIGFDPVKLHMVDDAATLPAELTAQLERLWLVGAEATGPDGFVWPSSSRWERTWPGRS